MFDMKLFVVLHNIRSTYNVGAILRTAEGLGADKIIYSGYTPRYADVNLLPHLRAKLNRQIAKAALGAEQLVAQEAVDDLETWLKTKKQQGAVILGLENNLDSSEEKRRIILGAKTAWSPSDELVLILGEEVAGIPAPIRQQCDFFLEIPMHGQKESFNVSVAAGIAIWALLNPTQLSES